MVNKIKIFSLEDLGYNSFFESSRLDLKLDKYSAARVIAEHRGAYRVKNENSEYLAKITGNRIHNALKREDYPAVGDWVLIAELDKDNAVIYEILQRKNILFKKSNNEYDAQVIAVNIDIAFIVESMYGDYNLNRFERYFILANEAKIQPVIILNKTDLISETELNLRIDEIKKRFNDIDVIKTSAITEHGLNALANYIERGKTYCFLGSSGVGKSSLINKLLNKNEIKTSEISEYSGKGKHTTTSREMYFLENGGIVIDNPGTREVGILDSNIGIENVFDEIINIAGNCKYTDCTHTHEPGCAVLKAIEDKEIDENKYKNYIKLKKEAEFYKMNKVEKREKDRKFGKFVKKALDQIKKNKAK
jgi:ribosome biogenesis GTPase / thiamine phosphate phosphatase